MRYCEESNIACVYVDAKDSLDFEKITLALARYNKNPANDPLVVIHDEVQARYPKVKKPSKPFYSFSFFHSTGRGN